MTFLIVDATAGYRLMWKGKDTRYTVFLDKRVECKPDIVCDNGLLPLRDRIADEIIYDPPHWIRPRTKVRRFNPSIPPIISRNAAKSQK
jgi:hypothetical protein